MMNRFLFGLCLVTILATACKDNGQGIDSSDTPILRVESVSPGTVKQFNEPVTLVLYYEDFNGDLGSVDPDEQVLSVKDSRLEKADLFHVKPIAPAGSNVPIKGTLEVKINSLFLLGNGNSEQVTFTVQIRDQAGNLSAPEVSPPVTVVK